MGRTLLGIVAVLAAGSTCGCSFVFVSAPPEHPERIPPTQHFDCTSSKAAPVIDTVIAGYQLFRTGFALAHEDSDYANAPISRPADIAIGVVLSALFIASAGYGYATTGDCEDAEEMHDKAIRQQWTQPPARMPPAQRPSRLPEGQPAPAFGPGFTSPAPPPSAAPSPPDPAAAPPTPPAAPVPTAPAAPAPSSTTPATGSSSAPASAAFPSQ